MGERDTGVGGTCNHGADAGNDLEGDPCSRKLGRLLAAAAEDIRVASLEADDTLPLAGLGKQESVGLLLLHGMPSRGFARIDALRLRRGMAQKLRIGEVVVDHHVCLREALASSQGEQAWITRARTHKVADPGNLGAGGTSHEE